MGLSRIRRLVIGCAVVLVPLAVPRLGFSLRPCTCKDVDDISRILDDTIRSEAAWDRIVYEMDLDLPGAPQNNDQAEKQFKKEVWPDAPDNTIKGGGLDSSGEPTINPQVEEQHCSIIVDSVKVHEQEHKNFYLHKYFWPSATAFTDFQRAFVRALSESDAYAAQAKYLAEQLEKLKKDCEEPKPKPQPTTSPDADQTRRNQAAQKHQIAKAATRVTQYANSLK